MDIHEPGAIYTRKMVVMRRVSIDRRKLRPKHRKYLYHNIAKVELRPCSFGHFTIGELARILNDIQYYPFKEVHEYSLPHGRYRVEIVEAEPDED